MKQVITWVAAAVGWIITFLFGLVVMLFYWAIGTEINITKNGIRRGTVKWFKYTKCDWESIAKTAEDAQSK